jgi:hypothetical protein
MVLGSTGHIADDVLLEPPAASLLIVTFRLLGSGLDVMTTAGIKALTVMFHFLTIKAFQGL